jgi:4-amino-4-deoxychorismate lyase
LSAALASTVYWLDGRPCESIPLPDRGLDYGDGLFETLLYAQGRLFYLDRHLSRLTKGLASLGFPECSERAGAELKQVCDQLATRQISTAALRLTITRGAGSRGYAPPDPALPRSIISATPLDTDWRQPHRPANLGTASLRLGAQPQLAGLKHLNRLEQVLAARERIAGGHDEMLMLDGDDNIVSVISGNLFIVADGSLLTPGLQTRGVLGTRRALVLDTWAAELGIPAAEQTITRDMLQRADEVFYCNALVGLCPVASADGGNWSEHPVCEALWGLYQCDNSPGRVKDGALP